MKHLLRLFLSALCILLPMAQAQEGSKLPALLAQLESIQQDETKTSSALALGKERSTLCSYCHGDTGSSRRDYIPNLAGQNAEYILRAMNDFSVKNRNSYVMEQVAAGLSAEEKVNISMYYAQQKPVQQYPIDGEITRGKAVYVSVCQGCHGEKGLGHESIPRIATQSQVYLMQTMTNVAAGSHTRRIPEMEEILKVLSEKEMRDVSAYLATLDH